MSKPEHGEGVEWSINFTASHPIGWEKRAETMTRQEVFDLFSDSGVANALAYLVDQSMRRAEKAETALEQNEKAYNESVAISFDLSAKLDKARAEVEWLKAAKIIPCRCRPGPQLECDKCGGWY